MAEFINVRFTLEELENLESCIHMAEGEYIFKDDAKAIFHSIENAKNLYLLNKDAEWENIKNPGDEDEKD